MTASLWEEQMENNCAKYAFKRTWLLTCLDEDGLRIEHYCVVIPQATREDVELMVHEWMNECDEIAEYEISQEAFNYIR